MRDALVAAGAAARAMGRPLVIVFADSLFGRILDNWLRHAAAAGVGPFLVLAMDEVLAGALRERGVPHAPVAFDGTTYDLWVRRAAIFAALAELGVDFIHSDADAVWHADIQARLLPPAFDLVFSQGTVLPPEALAAWDFVLCCGLFGVRAGPATTRWLDAVAQRTALRRDDQVEMNLSLVEAGVAWRREGVPSRRVRTEWSAPFTIHARLLAGDCAALGLRLGLLPHGAVPRLPLAGHGRPVVSHLLTPGDPVAKEAALRKRGLWREEGG